MTMAIRVLIVLLAAALSAMPARAATTIYATSVFSSTSTLNPNSALNAALADEAVIKRIRHEGAEPVPLTPAQYAADIDKEEIRWAALIKELGLVGK